MEFQPDLQELQERLKLLASDTSPHFAIRDADLVGMDGAAQLALQKSAVFSAHTIIVADRCSVLRPMGCPPPTARPRWSNNTLKSEAARIVQRHRGDPLFDEHFTVVPRSIATSWEEWEDEDNWYASDGKEDVLTLVGHELGSHCLSVSFSDPMLAAQWREESPAQLGGLSAFNIWLPELKGLSLETTLRLRSDEADSFTQFHRAVRRVVTGLGRVDSTSAIKALLEETDHEVREYERRITQVRRQLSRALAEAVVGSAVLGCCLLVPSETAKMLSAFIGSFHMKGFVQNLVRYRDQVSDLKASDFYAAALVGEKAREAKG